MVCLFTAVNEVTELQGVLKGVFKELQNQRKDVHQSRRRLQTLPLRMARRRFVSSSAAGVSLLPALYGDFYVSASS